MPVILKDGGNNIIFEFPSGCELVEEPLTKRLGTEPRVHAHGGVITADQRIETRIISLHGIWKEDTQALMETKLKSMKKAIYTRNLRLYSTQFSNDFYNVECLSFEQNFLGFLLAVEVNIDFLVSDPFRYYKDETTDPHTVDESSESFTVNNAGDIECSPVITFTVGAGANITKIKIENSTDSSKYFEYEPASALTVGKVVEIDCKNATCTLDAADDIAHFSGTFFELKSGNNSIIITITGTVGTNTANFVFRKRWL